LCKNSDDILRYIFTLNKFPLEYNLTEYINYYKNISSNLNEIKLENINNLYFINGYTIVPLLTSYDRHKIEYYNLCINININNFKNILIYHETYNNFYNIIKQYFTNINVSYFNKNILELKDNYYDLWFCGAYDIFNMDSCDWFYHRLNFYILQLIQIAKYLKNNSSCIIAFDFKFFDIDIYNQILLLYSCFMKIHVVSNKLVAFEKCYIIGSNINIDKLKDFYKKNNEIFNVAIYEMSFKRMNDNKCINTKPVFIDLNLKLSNNYEFYNNIKKIRLIHLNIVKKINYNIFNKNISIKTIIKNTFREIYKYICDKKIPINLNEYYLDNPPKILLKFIDINKIYLPNILNVNFKKLRLTPSALYSVTYPKEAIKIAKIIYDIVGDVKIIDACANVGGNTFGFAQMFKKVVSIELEKYNYKALKKNIKAYGFTNIKTKNIDCLEYIKNHNYNVIFFDPPWGGNLIYMKNSVNIMLSNIDINTIIENLLKKNKIVFLKVPLNFHTNLNTKVFKIKNYQLLYFTNH
jgi:16S rRNA G966 N2-methylase RsmD